MPGGGGGYCLIRQFPPRRGGRSGILESDLMERCRKAKDDQHRTLQEIADGADLPLATVTNYFSRGVKSPALNTIGPICAFLGVSVDDYLGIESPQQATEHEVELLQKDLEHERQTRQMLEAAMASKDKEIKRLTRLVSLLIVVAILILGYGIVIDWLNPHMGLIQY